MPEPQLDIPQELPLLKALCWQTVTTSGLSPRDLQAERASRVCLRRRELTKNWETTAWSEFVVPGADNFSQNHN
jgi:hypothetical protein